MSKQKPEDFFREADTVVQTCKSNIKKCLFGFILLVLLPVTSYSQTTLSPYFFKERLALITGFNDNNTWLCMAYLESSDLAVTSEECAERIQNSTESLNLKLQQENGEPFLFTLSPDKTTKGIRYLRPESSIPSETELSTDSYPIFDPAPNVDAWYPDISHEQLTFHSIPLLMPTGKRQQIENTTTIPYLISGSPVVHNGSPVCILSRDGRCASYDKSSCMKFCNEPGCKITYTEYASYEPDDRVVTVRCGKADFCEFHMDSHGLCDKDVWACKKKDCHSFFDESWCEKSSEDRQLQCRLHSSIVAVTAVTVILSIVILATAAVFCYYDRRRQGKITYSSQATL